MKSLILVFALLVSANAIAAPTSPESCQLKINGQVLWEGIATDGDGQGFFSEASQYSQRNGTCVHAKIDRVAGSGRVYNNGALVAANNGQKKGLTNAQADEAKARTGRGCTTFSCIPLVYNKAPQYEQPVQVPTGPVISNGSAE